MAVSWIVNSGGKRCNNAFLLLNGTDKGSQLFKIIYEHEITGDDGRAEMRVDLFYHANSVKNITDVLGSDYVPTPEDAIQTINRNKDVFLWAWQNAKSLPPIELVEELLKTHGFNVNNKELMAFYPDLTAMEKARIVYVAGGGNAGLYQYIEAEPDLSAIYTQDELVMLLNTLCKCVTISIKLLSHIASRQLAKFALAPSIPDYWVREIVKMLDHRGDLCATLAEQIYEAHGFFGTDQLALQLADATGSLQLRKKIKVATTAETKPNDECIICREEPRWFYWGCRKPDGSLYDHFVCARCTRPSSCLNGHAGHPELIGIKS